MSRVTPLQSSFNAGQLGPLMRGRVDQSVWQIGLEEMTGYAPMLQGPADAMPGSIFVASGSGPSRMIPYEFSATQGYVIEACGGFFRFYTNDARIETAPGVPYEIVTPWTFEQVAKLTWHFDGDALYLFHPNVQTRKLFRTSATTFGLIAHETRNGPWEARNPDESATITPGGLVGTVSLTCNVPLFEVGDVGGLIELETGSMANIGSWEPGITVTAGALKQWDGKVFEAETSGRTGTVPPEHSAGAEWDGMGDGTDINGKGPYGIRWRYRFSRYGQLRINAYISPTQVTGSVIDELASTAATWRWRFGAFSDRRGWPSCGAVWRERLMLGHWSTIYASVDQDQDDFGIRNELGDISRDMGFSYKLDGSDPIEWMIAADALHIGTSAAEHVMAPSSAAQGIGPGSVKAAAETTHGVAAIPPVRAEGRTIFVQKARAKVLQFGFADVREGFDAPDLTRFADDVGDNGLAGLVWQAEPRRMVWAHDDAGILHAALFVPEEQALGWCHRPMATGLAVKSMCGITDPDGLNTQVWMSVQSGGQNWILRMAPWRRSSDTRQDQWMTDASVRQTGADITTISAPHLSGREVHVVADGKVHPPVTLDGAGNGALLYAASQVTFGLPFPARIRTLPYEAGSDSGPAQMKIKRISQIGVRLLNSDGLAVGVQGSSLRQIELQQHDSPTDTAFPLFTGDKLYDAVGAYDRGGRVTIERTLPLPSTILAIMAAGQTGAA